MEIKTLDHLNCPVYLVCVCVCGVNAWASQVAQWAKNPPANGGDARDPDSILWLGRSPGGGHCNPLQYSCLENAHGQRSLQTTVHGAPKSQT